EELFAVSPDKTGANIPRSSCTQGWQLREAFQLGTQDSVPAPIHPDPIIRGIMDKGYYIWRDVCWAQRSTHWLAAETPSPLPRQTTGTATAHVSAAARFQPASLRPAR